MAIAGYALPTIIGAKVAAPERPAVAYVGDGAFAMSFGELLTCVREDIPVTAVVLPQQAMGRGKRRTRSISTTKRFPRREPEEPLLGGSRGDRSAEGVTVVDRLGDVGEALDKACAAQRRGKTTILEVMVTQELGDPFRRDALKYPKRLLAKYAHTNVAG